MQYTDADAFSSTKSWITSFTGSMTYKYLHNNVSNILLFEILVLINSLVLEQKGKWNRNIQSLRKLKALETPSFNPSSDNILYLTYK